MVILNDDTIETRTIAQAAVTVGRHQLVRPCVFARLQVLEADRTVMPVFAWLQEQVVDLTVTAQKRLMRQKSARIVPSRQLRTIEIHPDQQAVARVPNDHALGRFDQIGHGLGLKKILRQDRRQGLR